VGSFLPCPRQHLGCGGTRVTRLAGVGALPPEAFVADETIVDGRYQPATLIRRKPVGIGKNANLARACSAGRPRTGFDEMHQDQAT